MHILTNKTVPLFSKGENARNMLRKAVGGESMEIEKVNEFEAELKKYAAQVDTALQHARVVAVDSEDDAKLQVEIAGDLRKLSKKIDGTKKEITAPAREFVAKVNSLATSFTEKLEEAIDILSSKVGNFNAKKIEEQRQQLEEAKILEEATGSITDLVVSPVSRNTNVGNASTYQTKEWEIEVTDLAQVPTEFLMLDTSMVKAACKAGRTEIAGLKIVERMVTRIRSK